MMRLTLALGALVLALSASAPAQADWLVIRWANGDCKIWNDDGREIMPWGTGWKVLADEMETYGEAWATLEALYRQRRCV